RERAVEGLTLFQASGAFLRGRLRTAAPGPFATGTPHTEGREVVTDQGVMRLAGRTPRLSSPRDGEGVPRYAERASAAATAKLPPRATRSEEPAGSDTGSFAVGCL